MDIGDDKVFMYMKTRIAKTEHPMLFGIQEVVDDPYISIKNIEDGISQIQNDINQSSDLSFEQLVELFPDIPPSTFVKEEGREECEGPTHIVARCNNVITSWPKEMLGQDQGDMKLKDGHVMVHKERVRKAFQFSQFRDLFLNDARHLDNMQSRTAIRQKYSKYAIQARFELIAVIQLLTHLTRDTFLNCEYDLLYEHPKIFTRCRNDRTVVLFEFAPNETLELAAITLLRYSLIRAWIMVFAWYQIDYDRVMSDDGVMPHLIHSTRVFSLKRKKVPTFNPFEVYKILEGYFLGA